MSARSCPQMINEMRDRPGRSNEENDYKEYTMTILTTHEQQEIDRPNTNGKQPVAFVHGLWLLSSTWARWRARFEEQGYTTLAPGWPDDPQTVAQTHDNPPAFAH